MADEMMGRAVGIIEGYCGEGVIALPEVAELLAKKLSVEASAATELAIRTLLTYCGTERFRVHRGPARGFPPQVPRSEERPLVADRSAYSYGDGNEARTWFWLDCDGA